MAIDAILFDAGNTLVWLDHAFLVELLREHAIDVREEDLLAAEYSAKRLLDELVRSGNGATDATRGRIYFGALFRQLGIRDAILPELAARLEARHAQRNLWSRVRPGTAEALQELRNGGHRLGVISNADGRVEELLRSVGLAPYFDFIIDSHVVGFEKPDPRIFRLGCERAGAEPQRAIYVGDLFEIDVVGARGVGMRAILVDPLGRWTDMDCERITGIHELPALLLEEA